MTRRACGPLTRPCGEQGKLPSAKAFMLAERDKTMSEEKKGPRFMEELDRWTRATILSPLEKAAEMEFAPELVESILRGLRTKVLESYRNGQAAGPRNQFGGERRPAYVRGLPNRTARPSF
jgi:hypothetical protein